MILIVGAGLSGLLIAYHLKKEGIPFKILEARSRIGGRINTIYETDEAPLEMGATWVSNEHRQLKALLKELGIDYFKQSISNRVFYESSPLPVQLVQIPYPDPSFRISGGTSSLLEALLSKLDETDILLNQAVKQITINANSVQVETDKIFEGNRVVLAIPPKLWAQNIVFEPHLPSDLMNVALQTQTWMENSIKFALTYNQPFWGDADFPGTLMSNAGPIIEMYDHSNHDKSKYALGGFIDSSLTHLTFGERREQVVSQLKNVYGAKAIEFTNYEECLWNKEEYTFTASDNVLSPHQNNGHQIYNSTLFDDKLLISSTEAASEFPGYMEGAVRSASLIAEKIVKVQD